MFTQYGLSEANFMYILTNAKYPLYEYWATNRCRAPARMQKIKRLEDYSEREEPLTILVEGGVC